LAALLCAQPEAAGRRSLRLDITASTGWPAGQVSEFEVYAS
jgi:hypothetical protein